MGTTRTLGALCADDSGGEDGRPPIVLVHGLTFDRHIWTPVIDAVRACDRQRRVIALDLPGHGQSPPCPPHDLSRVADLLHEALEAAGVSTPVLVGHSMSGGLVTVYAARYPSAGVVNVDQPPVIGPFAALVRSLEPELRGPRFDDIWRDIFAASFHLELLPAYVRDLVQRNGRADRELVLSYWQQVLDRPAGEMQELIDDALAQIGQQGCPYVLVVGSELAAAARDMLQQHVPAVQILEWPGTGHFPHLARSAQFAELLHDMGGQG
jgi:pimeloyl-ACP methyl ester carboxylesterase